MTWTPLAGRLDELPLILAGPVLRQVTPKSVTVWVALQKTAKVTLTVFDRDTGADRPKLGEGVRSTVAIGQHLHVVAVTARIAQPLLEGKVFFYDMRFDGPDTSRSSILKASTRPSRLEEVSRLAYGTFKLPSFVLPPADLNKLRLIHGSCRKPHGGTPDPPFNRETPDALGMLDVLIDDTADKPFDRPHQLLLTGDQIYADEVAEVLLLLLTDAGDTLMGWREELPKSLNEANIEGGPYEGAKLPPSTRTDAIAHARFTSQDTRSHLMTLAEFLAMYLFVWSDELSFDPDPFPTVAQVKAAVARIPDSSMSKDVEAEAEDQRKALNVFAASIKKVRRALANIPTYMICDDHEITDDWNMTRRFCETVYDSPLGMRIIQNGLVAFSICQAWGNKPEQFWDGSQAAGAKLLVSIEALSRIEQGGAHVYHTFDAEIRQRVGINNTAALKARPVFGVFHETSPLITVEGVKVSSTSILYHFTVEGPSHQVIVTDTRTWRSFPIPGQEMHAELLDEQARVQQLEIDAPRLNDRVLLVVATTNIPPIPSVREAAFLGSAANYYVGKKAGATYYKLKKFIYDNDLLDSWEFPDAALDRLLVTITNKFPKVGGALTGQAVFMSGDVHFTFASRLAYWADVQRLDDPAGAPQQAKAVFAQLVASALKNEKDATRGLQKQGYGYTPKSWQQSITWTHDPTGYVGWNVPPTAPEHRVGRIKPGIVASGVTLKTHGKSPTLPEQITIGNNDFVLEEKPHYRYRIDYLRTIQTGQTFDPTGFSPGLPNDREGAVRRWANAGRAHRDLIHSFASPPAVIGFNSISEVTFVWQRAGGAPASSANDPLATNRRVRQTVRWEQRGVEADPMWAMYEVSLDPDDPAFPRIPAEDEP